VRTSWLRALVVSAILCGTSVTALTVVSSHVVAGAVPAVPGASAGPCGDVRTRPWCDTSLSANKRAGLLLHALTENEKISLLAGIPSTHTGQTPAIPRVGLRSVRLTDDSKGVKQGLATALPIPLSIAASFDRHMADVAGSVIGNEAKHKGDDILLGPTVNIMRTPLNGRTFEAFGEDPYLVSHTAVPWIEGLQGQGVIGEVKHYCCNNQEGPSYSTGKMYSSSNLDERTLREIYLPAFEAAVKKAHVGSVMCAYNRVNEDWACENKHLLTDILRHQWHFRGVVISDWQAQHNTVSAMRNGLDIEMPTPLDYSQKNVKAALAAGLITQAEINGHVRNFLRTLFSFGFMDRPAYRDDNRINFAKHERIAMRMEERGMVLLKNNGILPLNTHTVHSIAVIGPQARRFENGGGADDVKPERYVTPMAALRSRVGRHVKLRYDDGSNLAHAAATARRADVAVVFASDSEGEDREKIAPTVDGSAGSTSDQTGLINAVAAANKHTIVVLETGDPVVTPWRNDVAGMIEAWYPGEAGGAAIAHVLFGDADPGGRLPVSFPASSSKYPTANNPTTNGPEVDYSEGVFVGYRWYDENHVSPAYPFGYGLSYSRFRFSHLRVSGHAVRVTVANTGHRAGVAVPELYLGMPSPSAKVKQPPRQLKGYRSVRLAPGQRDTVSFPLNRRSFSYWNVNANRWRVARGCYRVEVGSSSRHLPLRGVISRGGAHCSG
jgi:beta-glucosidase